MEIRQIKAEETWELRQKVMWPDKDIEYVKIADDAVGVHYGMFDDEQLISVISLFFDDNQSVQFRKFATLSELQGKGYGTRLLRFVMDAAKKLGVKKIWCNARKDKSPFYQRFGLREVGDTFERDGMQYIRMSRELADAE